MVQKATQHASRVLTTHLRNILNVYPYVVNLLYDYVYQYVLCLSLVTHDMISLRTTFLRMLRDAYIYM
jgi:hypothetical protein